MSRSLGRLASAQSDHAGLKLILFGSRTTT